MLSWPFLLFEDKERLTSGKWLNYRLIEASQVLLAKYFPDVKRLQSPLFGEKLAFKRVEGKFVQILNVERLHWITVTNIGCEEGVVMVYDSLFNTMSLNSKQQICSLYQPTCSQLEFRLANIQRQPNTADCRLLAIACATELVQSRDPTCCNLNVSQMRQHLAMCLESGKMEAFPLRGPRRQPVGRVIKKSIIEPVYCKCRMLNDPSVAMICFDKCNEWYHKVCVCVGLDVDMSDKEWFCYKRK